MSIARCPICGDLLENSGYDGHMAWRHPEFQRDWFPPLEVNPHPHNEYGTLTKKPEPITKGEGDAD